MLLYVHGRQRRSVTSGATSELQYMTVGAMQTCLPVMEYWRSAVTISRLTTHHWSPSHTCSTYISGELESTGGVSQQCAERRRREQTARLVMSCWDTKHTRHTSLCNNKQPNCPVCKNMASVPTMRISLHLWELNNFWSQPKMLNSLWVTFQLLNKQPFGMVKMSNKRKLTIIVQLFHIINAMNAYRYITETKWHFYDFFIFISQFVSCLWNVTQTCQESKHHQVLVTLSL